MSKTVITYGTFDLFHIGHLRLIERLGELGDRLVIGLNSDSSVRAIKGERRPIVPQEQRAEVLAAMACVDHLKP